MNGSFFKHQKQDKGSGKGVGKNWIARNIPKNRCVTFDEFVKRTLIGLYYSWQKYDYWTHNRAVEQAAKDAEENPPVLPDISDESN